MAHPRRGGDRLHRARRALRELHPPVDDSLDAAISRHRRAARAAVDTPGPRRRRADRPRAPDRHREEERDHDDRLRARGAAGARRLAARRDLSGVAPALPSHHDDDHGGAPGWAAARAGSGPAQSCGDRSGSRSSGAAGQPGADALHDAGDVPGVRATLRARAGDGRELSEPFIRRPVATSLLAWRWRSRVRWRSRTCRSPRCRRWPIRRSS